MEQIVKVNLLIKEILVRIVVLIVMVRNLIGINIIVTIGVGLIAWLESDKWGRIIGLTGEYGQLIIEYGIVATILSVLAVVVMDREKEKKGMERVGLIVLATLGMIILVGAEDLLTVYLAMEAQSLAFYTLAGLLLGVLAVRIALLFKIEVAPFHMWLLDIYQGSPTIITSLSWIISGLFVELSILFYICSLASMVVEAIAALNQSYIKRLLAYSAIAHVGYVLLALAVGSYTSIFSLLVYMILYIITSITLFNFFKVKVVGTPSTPIASSKFNLLNLYLFLFIWTRASLLLL